MYMEDDPVAFLLMSVSIVVIFATVGTIAYFIAKMLGFVL